MNKRRMGRTKDGKILDNDFTTKLQALRLDAKISLPELSEITNIPLHTLNNWLYVAPPRDWAKNIYLNWVSISLAHWKRN